MSTPASTADPVVQSPDGRISGLRLEGGVQRFLGMPYAAPPVGPLRLRGPRPVMPWPGLRDGTRPAPASLQTLGGNQVWMNEPIERQAEDCLYLNVWTPDVHGSAPVLFWLHGGQTRNGHGAAPGIDGAALARRGIVVVTINYRLGGLGGLAHPDLVDETTGYCANWGLQDKLAALAWVQRCIASFGGDPARVTLAGQSSGGANAVMVAQHGLGQGQYARVIAQSPPLFRPPMFVDLDKAAEYTEALAQAMGVTVTGLRDVDGPVLQKAEHAFAYSPELTARMGRPRTAPVRENNFPAGAIPNVLIESVDHKSPITTGPWRAPITNFLAGAEQSFFDEVAEAAGKDPVTMRLDLFRQAKAPLNAEGKPTYDAERFIKTIELAAEKSGWFKKRKKGVSLGFSVYYSHLSYVAQVAEVVKRKGKFTLQKVYCAVDCGIVVNLSGALNQVVGSVVDGLGHAMYGQLTFKDGETQQKNFNTYRLIRMNEIPEVEVHFVDNGIDPTGLGEPALPPLSGAVANAFYKAMGKRMRDQPFLREGDNTMENVL